MQSTHGKIGCVTCHTGHSESEDKDAAHAGLIADPSGDSCGTCHKEVAELCSTSLHTSLNGYTSILETRGGNLAAGSPLDTALENHCNECHTTCGQCHISRPTQSGGGLVSNHKIKATPSMPYNCIGCHGSRVGDEYLGNNVGISADVHWKKAGMICTVCHGEVLHGTGKESATRYDNPDSIQCESCHQNISGSNMQHQQHLGNLACQVCHSTTYSNCYNCHVAIDDEGLPYRTSDETEMNFKIGHNPLKSDSRPYEYVLLRHVPVTENTFDYYGDNLLPEFDAEPTWKYTTPHNIQLHTPQNADCSSCHGNEDLFLTEDDVSPEERMANRGVIVSDIPGD